MADVPRPTGQASQPPAGSATLVTPGWVTFAAMMMFLLGGFQLAWAFVEFGNIDWFAATSYGSFGGHLWLWGVVDIALALAVLYAAFDVLAGGRFGQVFGLVIAGISAVRWFFYLPAAPWVAVVVIVIDALIIYGLVAHADYFGAEGHERAY